MLSFANEQIASRLGKLAFQVSYTASVRNADAIHDLRVAIRRFSQSVTIFASLLPKQEAKRVRKRLRRIMEVAGQVRDCDIALEFLDEAGVPGDDALRAAIVAERTEHEKNLLDKIGRWSRSNVSAKWRSALRLNLQGPSTPPSKDEEATTSVADQPGT